MRNLIALLFVLITGNIQAQTTIEKIQQDFLHPGNDSKPGCYWYWINDNVSKEGITKDLEAMKRVGIGRAYIGHIYDRRNETDTKPGTVKFMTDEWWAMLQWAVKEADRCQIDIGFFNGPGWSQSGGPWIKTTESMRFLANSDTTITGGKKIAMRLPYPNIETYPNRRAGLDRSGPNYTAKDFQQVRVVAFRAATLPKQQALTVTINRLKINNLNDTTSTVISTDKEQVILFEAQNKSLFRASNFSFEPKDFSFKFIGKIEASTDGEHFTTLTNYEEERGHQGPKKLSPLVISFKPTVARIFRVSFQLKSLSANKKIRLSTLNMGEESLLNGYVRKQLAETCPYTKIPWDAYSWPEQEVNKATNPVTAAQVLDITRYVDQNGILRWQAPAGKWTIQRFGMVPIGTQCHPCSEESRGLEVDKLNSTYVKKHFEAMVGEFLRRTKPEDRRALKYVVADSYETGPQNWTDGFIEKFEKKFNYSSVPYLPVLTGKIIGNEQLANRFLWDLRKLITDAVAEDYVGGLREICNRNGLKLWLENYGHWGFPSEFLYYGSKSDEIGGEIWESSDPVNNVECRAAASAAHIYGKNEVYNEVFTSNRNFRQNPATLKRWADWSYGAGINSMILHVYIHQPDERKPGIIEWFGTAFNRHNTWFEQSGAFIDYMRRSGVLLKSGIPVADIAYYIGEHSPSMSGAQLPKLPVGYDFDNINADVLINQTSVENGRIKLKSGVSYAVLVLPPVSTMRLEVATAIKKLVAAGAIVIGTKPLSSPTLQMAAMQDAELKKITDQLWPKEGIEKAHQYGLGWVYSNLPLEDVLRKHQIAKDVELLDAGKFTLGVAGDLKSGIGKTGAILFKHRKLAEADIFFLANTTNEDANLKVAFRTDKSKAYLFNAVTGTIEPLDAVEKVKGSVIAQPSLESAESLFVLFTNEEIPSTRRLATNSSLSLDKDWKLEFKGDTILRGNFKELMDWTKFDEPKIKYFSGTVNYTKNFELNEPIAQAVLDLGQVGSIATVTLNDNVVGTVWTNPWKIDVTKALKSGTNTLKIEVTNDWNNKLVGDILKKTSADSYVSQPYNYDKKQPLLSSGLLGPVTLYYTPTTK